MSILPTSICPRSYDHDNRQGDPRIYKTSDRWYQTYRGKYIPIPVGVVCKHAVELTGLHSRVDKEEGMTFALSLHTMTVLVLGAGYKDHAHPEFHIY